MSDDKAFVSFEAVAFLAGIAATFVSVNQSSLSNHPNLLVAVGFINFLIGMALASFGGIIVSRILTKVEITESDPTFIKFVEVCMLSSGICSLMFATAFVCFLIEPYSGILICILGGIAIMISVFAHIKKRVNEERKEHRKANVVNVVAKTENPMNTSKQEV